jgi:hypothetical protein
MKKYYKNNKGPKKTFEDDEIVVVYVQGDDTYYRAQITEVFSDKVS